MTAIVCRLTAVVLILGALPLPSMAGWPHWRGPTRNGHSPDPSGWDGKRWLDPKPRWAIQVGKGSSSPLVVAQKLFALGWNGGRDYLTCRDLATGKEHWGVSYPSPEYGRHHLGDTGFYGGPSSTPEYDPHTAFLYTLSNDGELICWDAGNQGERMWSVSLYDRFKMPRRPKVGPGGEQRDYGYTSSPLIHGDWLVVEVGGDQGHVMAFDKKTGAVRWGAKQSDRAGHTGGPVPMIVAGISCVATLSLTNLVVTRLDKGHEGETLAAYPYVTNFANSIPSPAVFEDQVLITSKYNQKKMLRLAVAPSGITKVWEKPTPSGVCTPVIHKGHVYFSAGAVQCLDWKTGDRIWDGGNFGEPGSCTVTADDRLIVWGGQGLLTLIDTAERSPAVYRELAVVPRVSSTFAWPHVVLSGSRVVCKDRSGNVKCFATP